MPVATQTGNVPALEADAAVVGRSSINTSLAIVVLPATALADQGDSLSRRDLQGHAIDRAYNTTPAEVALLADAVVPLLGADAAAEASPVPSPGA